MTETRLKQPQVNCPCLLIAAPSSGSGKTTVTAALARWHSSQGRKVTVFKIGPDFIDPTILQQASGAPVYSLDAGMMGKDHYESLLFHAAESSDLILLEGMMGLFDGHFSAASLAKEYQIPVAFVIDVRAMAETFAAVSYGMANLDQGIRTWGTFANRVASPKHEEMLLEGLNAIDQQSIPWLGMLRFDAAMQFPERHLGLVQAQEIQDLTARLDLAAAQIATQPLSQLPPAVSFPRPQPTPAFHRQLKGTTIAIAKDKAFSFVYAANLDFLRQQGADLVFTSPLNDTALPDCHAIYFPGGYPELYAQELSRNISYLESLRAFKGRILAECGGMIYLSRTLTLTDHSQHKMGDLLPLDIQLHNKLQSIGWQLYRDRHGETRGHSFHYSSISRDDSGIGTDTAECRNGKPGENIYRLGNTIASYLHWYFPSNPAAAISFFR